MFASPLSCSSYTFVAYVMFISGMGFRSSGWFKGIGQDEQHLWESPRKKWVALSDMHSGGFHTYRGREYIHAPHGEILCSSYPALVYRVSENTSRPGHGSGAMSVFILSATCVINMTMRDWIALLYQIMLLFSVLMLYD